MIYREIAIEQVLSALTRIPDPDFILNKLGMGRYELRKLETDDEISAALETRRDAILATPWRLEGADNRKGEWLWRLLEPHIDGVLRGVWSAVPYGYSVLETVYKEGEGGKIEIEGVKEKPMEWFEPMRDGQLKLTIPGTGQIINVDTELKFLLTVRSGTYRNPYGEALLSRAYWPWFFRANGWRFWVNFLERFADPLILGKSQDPVSFVEAIQRLGYQAVIGVELGGDVSAITPSAAGEFEKLEHALCRRIQKLILGQTLTSDVSSGGSYAAASVHNDVRSDKRRSDIRLITPTVQRLINALWKINQFTGNAPSFVMSDDTGLESARADRDVKLANAGIVKFTQKYLLDRYDLEPEDFEMVASAETVKSGSNLSLSAKTAKRYTKDQQMLEDLVDSTLENIPQPISEQKIKDAIELSTNEEDLVVKLTKLSTNL